jgi:GNAT superfamily N-acetyltransferase
MVSPLTIRPRTPDDDPQIVDILNRCFPDYPPRSLEQFRHLIELATADPRDYEERLVAEQDGAVVAELVLEKHWWLSAPDIWWASITVDPDRWAQGIGGQLYRRLTERAQALGVRRLYGQIREDLPRADRFVTDRGFRRTGHADRLSRLAVVSARFDGYEGIAQQLREQGIRIVSLEEIGADDEQLLRQIHELEARTVKDIPSSEEQAEFWPFDLWRKEMLTGPGRSPRWFFLALAGQPDSSDGEQPIGVARLRLEPGQSWAFNGYTGVDRAYRGRGVARALKLRTIEWARQNGVDAIYTGNDVDNKRMLDINIRLGYRPLPSALEVVKDLE